MPRLFEGPETEGPPQDIRGLASERRVVGREVGKGIPWSKHRGRAHAVRDIQAMQRRKGGARASVKAREVGRESKQETR